MLVSTNLKVAVAAVATRVSNQSSTRQQPPLPPAFALPLYIARRQSGNVQLQDARRTAGIRPLGAQHELRLTRRVARSALEAKAPLIWRIIRGIESMPELINRDVRLKERVRW